MPLPITTMVFLRLDRLEIMGVPWKDRSAESDYRTGAMERAPAALRPHDDSLLGPNAESPSVGWVDLNVNPRRVELAEHGRLGSSRLRVPLRGSSSPSE